MPQGIGKFPLLASREGVELLTSGSVVIEASALC